MEPCGSTTTTTRIILSEGYRIPTRALAPRTFFMLDYMRTVAAECRTFESRSQPSALAALALAAWTFPPLLRWPLL